MLARLDRRIGGVRGGSAGYIYTLGIQGQKFLNEGRRARRHREPGWPFLRHTLTISELFVTLQEEAAVRPDRHLITFDPEPHCWRTLHAEEEMHLRPDAYAVIDDSHKRNLWFIEVDLGTESRPTIRRKMNQYAKWFETGFEQQRLGAQVFPRVFWFAPDDKRRSTLQMLADSASGPSGLHTTVGLFATASPPRTE